MSCNTTDDVRIIMKYSTISGATPSIPLSDNHEDGTWIPTDLYIGEFFTNAADDTYWIRTDNGISQLFGGTGGTGSFIGDFVHISGGTFSGLVFAPTFSANYLVGGTVSGDTITADYFIGGTYSGDGSLLTGIVATWSGGTVSDGVYFTNEAKFTNDTWLDGNVYSTSGINISGSVSISGGILTSDYFVGDGSGLTNLPTGTFSDIYTTGATLSGDTIIFSRNDSNTYDIDLSPILNQQSITTMTWDSSIDELLTTFNDASTIGLTIDSFAQVSSTGPITAPEFYGGIFYGEFVGTYSNDIYTISATLSGTDAIFTRTDGASYSLDLSTLSGGGGATPSLSDVLSYSNVSGSQSIIMNKGYGIYSIENQQTGVTLIDAGVVRVIATDGILPFPTDEAYIDVQGNGNIGLEGTGTLDINFDSVAVMGGLSFSGIEYVNDYSADYTNRSLVDKEYVDNTIAGATPSLSDVLLVGNTTGTYSIIVEDYSSLKSPDGESNILFTTTGIDISVVGITYSNYETNESNLSSREIIEIGLTNSSNIYQDFDSISSTIISTTNDRDMSLEITGDAINSTVNETSTAFYSSTSQRNHIIEAYVQDADYLFSETKNAYKYKTKVDNQTLDVNTTFTQNEDNVEMSITDNGWSTFIQNTLSGLSNGSKQQRLQISPNPSIFVTDDKRAGWMQTSDDTTTLMIYCDIDPATGSTSSIVQIKAHVRGISSDKLTGYAAEITSWVRLDQLGPTPVTQIGVVDYIIKSEFTTAYSSFVISGPNMYIDVTGEIGITIDWTCNVEILYDKNIF